MRTNLVQTCKTSANRINLNRTAMRVALIGLFISLGVGNAWAHDAHYGKAVLKNATGHGTVYLSTASDSNKGQTSSSNPGAKDGTSWITWDCGEDENKDSKTYYARYSAAEDGWYYAGWANAANATSYTASTTGKTFSTSSTNSGSPTTTTIYGYFKPVTVTGAPANVNINATDPLATYPAAGGDVLSFTTANSNKIGDFTTGASGDARWNISSWTRASASSATFNYKFVGDGSYGETDRTFTKTVTLTSKGDASSTKSCTLTAKYPNPKVVSGDDSDEYTKLFTAFAAIGDQETVTKTIVFDVVYADDGNNFTAAFSGVTGGGAWNVTGITVDQNNQKATVTYTFNGNKAEGTHTATLTLTAKDCNGWDNTEAEGSASASVIITATNEQEATNEVSVTTAAGVTTEYATWADGLTAANANEGSTIKLMRNVSDVNTLQTITKSVTIDLNGKTISGTGATQKISSTTYYTLFYCGTAGKTITIKDSKTGGKIKAIRDLNARLHTFVSYNGNHIVLQSGTVESENTGIYNSSSKKSVGTCPIYVKTKSTFTQDGGVVSSIAGRNAYGVIGEASATTHSTVTLNAGEIKVSTPVGAYGVVSTGEINIHEGAIVNVRTESVNGVAGGTTAYGIQINASANATDASSYYGTLNMDGGTIRVFTTTTTCYGILVQGVTAAATSATDGTHSNKATPHCNITGGSIDVYSTSTTAQGIQVIGDTNTKTGEHVVAQIKNCNITVSGEHPSGSTNAANIYGVYVHAVNDSARLGLRQGDVELTNCNVSATARKGQTAVAVYVHAVQFSKLGDPYKEEEVATAGKVTINSGTYTAETSIGRYAYAVQSAPRVKSVLGTAEAYPTVIIHGGTFTTTSGTTDSYAVNAGGNTTIDGGTFNATSGSSSAIGIIHRAGKLIVSGVRITSHATTSSAFGIYLTGAIHDYTGYAYASDAELNNIDATVTTGTGSTAYGVWLNAIMKSETQARYDTYMAGTANAVTKSYYDRVWSLGGHAIAPKVTINGGTYKVTSATSTAYGAWSKKTAHPAELDVEASPEMTIKNATFNVTSTTSTAGGVRGGGPVTVDNCDITVKATTETAYGVLMDDKTGVVSNSTIDVTTPTGAYGLYANSPICAKVEDCWGALGIEFVGKIEANDNIVTAKATGGNTSYAVYVNAAKAATASGPLAGDHAIAGEATINGGKYTATASGTTAYAAGVADPVLQGEATATPTLIINGGKFKGTAGATPFADVSLAGEPGYFVLNGGYYVKDENLDKKLGEGMNKVAVKSGTPEYTEGYRWRVTDNMTGEVVCKVYKGTTLQQSFQSLEEALQYVNLNASSSNQLVIVMCGNYTLSKGDYELPQYSTLLIPYKSSGTGKGATQAIGTSPEWTNITDAAYVAPTPLYKLTFESGVNMTVKGIIEASARTYLSNEGLTSIGNSVVTGNYGWLQLNEGARIDLESGARLQAWGYVTGKGEINAKNNSEIYEDFQLGDWRGGSNEVDIAGNTNGLNKKGVFVITHYFYQNVECPVTYRPGAKALAYGGAYMNYVGNTVTQTAVGIVGVSNAMFLMDPATAGEDTWVRKEYDAETDYLNWKMNSGAKLGTMSMNFNYVGDVNSTDYVLPITSNFNIIANSGEITITSDVCFIPGSKLTIKKEATITIQSGVNVFFYDQDDWASYSGYYFHTYYSPSWKMNPRIVGKDKTKNKQPDAWVQIEGLLNIQGAAYTTAGGANLFSTREHSGKVAFGKVAPASTSALSEFTTASGGANKTLCQLIGGVKYNGKALNSVWLKNEDGTFAQTVGTAANKTWIYMKDDEDGKYKWILSYDDGCFTYKNTGGGEHQLIHPSDWVAVGSVNANHAYPSEDATRMFVNAEAATTSASCVWWEVNPTPEVIDGTTYYVANNDYFDNFGTYYYWDNTTSYWKPKKITVTWKNEDGTKITNGTYGDLYSFNTSPQFFGTNPKKTPTAIEKYDWIGWRDAEGNIYDKNATLPRATSDVTYTAYFNTTKYQYTITFKNDDNSDLWAGLVDAGTTGAELQALFETKYNEKTGSTIPLKASSVDKVYTFSSWNTSLATVTAAATYTANYTWVTRKYHVTFYSYDAATVLYEADVDYNTTRPVYGGVTPFRSNTSAYSYEWTGWQQGATHYGTTDNLALVTGDVYYVATFSQTTLKYQVLFKRQDGSIIDAPFFSYEETPAAFPDDPTLASTVSTDYTFREWSPATLVPVTEDGKVYTALFDESPRKYTAHFVNYNGVSLNVDQTIDYNTVPAYTGVTPMKPNDSRNSYEFSGWAWAAGDGWEAGSIGVGEAFPAIKGDITFTAQYTPTLLQFDVIYQREDGFVILRDKKKWGESTAFPTSGLDYEDATYSYTFDHWSPATLVNPVTTDATYTAYYNQSIKTYSITAVGISPAGYGTVSPASLASIPGGSTVTVNGNKITVNGTTITATPAAADAQYTYTFDHWNNVPATVTGNVTNIEAVFTRTTNTYTVTWKNYDGTTLETDENVAYGTTPTYNGATPTKTATAEYTYTFTGWDNTPVAVTGDATYNATFSSTKNSYEITWLNDDNSLIDKTTVEYGVVPTHADATKANTAEYTYTFIGWDNTPVAVTGAATYKATFSSTKNSYEITWLNDDNSLIDKTTVEYGVVPTHADATKVNTAEYTYTFTGWDNTPVAVTGAATYKATFSAAKNSYEITWLNDDNSLIDKTTVEYGIVPTHAEATKANTASNCYTFAGWDSEIVAVTGAKTYKATFSASPTVASVTVGGATTYYATLQAAFDYAAAKTTPTITVLKAVSSSPKLTYTNSSNTTVTFDLNGYKVAGGANPLLYITGNNSGKFIIKDGSVEKTGQLYNRLSATAARACVHVYNCPTEFQSGTIYMENTSTSTSTSVAAYGVNVRSGRKFDMTGGTIKVVSKKSAQGIYTAGTTTISNGTIDVTETANGTAYGVHVVNGTTTINGNVEDPTYPKVSVTATKGPRGVIVGGIKPALNSAQTSVTQYNGKLYVNGGTYTVTASADGTTAYGVYAYRNTYALNYSDNATCPGNYVSAGTATITAGDFTVTASGADATAYGVCIQSATSIQTALKEDGTTKYAKKTATPKGSITGGKYIVSGATKGAVNTSSAVTAFTVQGGWYNIETGLATYTAPAVEGNYRVLDLTGEDPYKYEVAEAYTITFNNNDGTQLQSTAVKKGATPAYSGTTPTKAEDESYTYSFTGWSPAITAVSATATYTAQFSSTPRTYDITLNTNGGTINAGNVEHYTVGTGATLPTNVTKDGHEFGGWFDNSGLTGDAVTTISTTATGNKEYWAKWTASIADRELDIVDWTSNSVTINVTNLKAVGGTNKNNWKIYANGSDYTRNDCSTTARTLTISGLSLTPNENLLIQLKNDAGVIESQHNYTIPFIYTSTASLSEETTSSSVVYVYGGKLTISGNTTLAALYVCPGAEVEVTGTLTVGKLVLRTKPWATAAISGNVSATNVYYTRIAPDGSSEYPTGQYYQFGLPYECAISAVLLSDGTEPAYNTTWILKSYNEERRAEYGTSTNNWDALAADATIEAGRGYEMFSSYKYYREYYFPVTPTDNTLVDVTRTGNDKNNSGWNVVCSPLMSIYENNSNPVDGLKVSWLLADGSYDQEWPATIWPALPFSYQASATGYLDFSKDNFGLQAPRRRAAYDATVQTEWLHLDVKDGNGVGDHTSVFVHPDRFEATYQTGIDVAKQSFEASRALIYSSHAYGEMAFAGVADALLENGVALTVYSPKPQELTISMRDNEWLDRMAYVWLIDNETGAQIDLLDSDYTFEAAAGTTTGRFILMGRFFAPQIATDIDEVDGEQAKPKKLIIRDKLYILINDQLYDGTGKMVK